MTFDQRSRTGAGEADSDREAQLCHAIVRLSSATPTRSVSNHAHGQNDQNITLKIKSCGCHDVVPFHTGLL